MNPRVTPKDMNLIKGAFRRAFARTELHHQIILATLVPAESVPEEIRFARPRVKNWAKCPVCLQFEAKSYIQVDHIDPVIPVDRSLADLEVLELIDRIWCEPENLRATCKTCHTVKTKAENELRKVNKRAKKQASFTNQTPCVKVKKRTARRPKA